jgi:galactonate dehydratase
MSRNLKDNSYLESLISEIMKVTRYELFKVPPRWLFLKIETSDGITGWGEPIVEGRADTTAAAVRELMEMVTGRDPFQTEDLWNTMYRDGFYRGGPVLMSALSGIDQALWDIKGKFFNTPVHNLMGGRARDRIQVYSSIAGETPDEIRKAARQRVDAGFMSLKMTGVNELQIVDSHHKIDRVAELVGAVRNEVGPATGIAVDLHGRVQKPMAKSMVRALEPYNLLFVEEPVLPENNEVLRDIAKHTSIPIATGERMFSRWHFKDLLVRGYADIIQPDLSHAGGITECKKILSMAEAFDVAGAPHCPLGPIALASCLQVDATCHNVFIQEQSLGIGYHKGREMLEYISNPEVFEFREGFVDIPAGPGLGLVINEEKVREEAKTGHNWRGPEWRHPDGSVAEW